MPPIVHLLHELSSRLDRRTRRFLVFGSAAGLTLFAQSTVAAARSGALPDVVAGVALLVVLAAASAMAWSAPRR